MNKKEECVRELSTQAHKTPTKWAAQSDLSGSVRGAALLPLSLALLHSITPPLCHCPHLTLHTRATRDTMLLSLPSHETSRKKK